MNSMAIITITMTKLMIITHKRPFLAYKIEEQCVDDELLLLLLNVRYGKNANESKNPPMKPNVCA